MTQQSHDQPIAGHNYDGIEELDNPLPRWWLYGFYLTIVFSVLYVLYYHIGPGPSLAEVYAQNMAQLRETRKSQQPTFDSQAIAALKADSSAMTVAATIFAEKCAACHGEKAQGIIGPNLTDDYWLHGAQPQQIASVIQNGVSDKGMPPWGEMLSAEDIQRLVAYILSLHGTNPPGAKEPQGEKIPPSIP